jgi:DNA-binding LacI/PurR family transcriptional regulator
MRQAGLDAFENSVLWLEDPLPEDAPERIAEFVAREQLTAVLCGAWFPVQSIASLVADNRLRVPHDLSVVNFDQCWHVRPLSPYTGLHPTVVALPLEEMGRQLARMARQAADGQPVSAPAPLPCTLIEGNTVSRLNIGL